MALPLFLLASGPVVSARSAEAATGPLRQAACKPGARKARKRAKARAKKRRPKGPVEIPINIGVGPALHMAPGGLGDASLAYTGIRLDLFGVVGKQVVRDNLHRIPRKYARLAKAVTEVRVNPIPWVPKTLMISPERKGDDPRPGMYGAMWRLVGLGVSSGIGPLRLGVSAGAGATYLFLHGGGGVLGESDSMHFLRPGLDLRADIELPLTDSLLVSVGWSSFVFPPQEVDGAWLKLGEPERSIWHVGQVYALLHVRVPYQVNL